MSGSISSRPCDAVNVVASAPACRAPCSAPAAPPSLCISITCGHGSPQVRAPRGRPGVGELAHRGGGRDRVDRDHLREAVRDARDGLVAVDGHMPTDGDLSARIRDGFPRGHARGRSRGPAGSMVPRRGRGLRHRDRRARATTRDPFMLALRCYTIGPSPHPGRNRRWDPRVRRPWRSIVRCRAEPLRRYRASVGSFGGSSTVPSVAHAWMVVPGRPAGWVACHVPGGHAGGCRIGTEEAHLFRVAGEGLELIAAFDHIAGRGDRYTPWRAPADTRSISESDEYVYVSVLVGGILRSTDRGDTWPPTVELATSRGT